MPGLFNWLKRLRQPSASRSVLSLLAIGLLLGVGAVVAFDAGMHATSTEEFCTSCHELSIPTEQWKKTSHYANSQGVSASCPDCHIPQEFVPKMIRKVQAAREVWGSITGVIDTPEKYAAHAPQMKAREIARLKANDSQECRNCHNEARWLTAMQTAKAQKYHSALETRGKTCIDCHAGIAHPEHSAGLADVH